LGTTVVCRVAGREATADIAQALQVQLQQFSVATSKAFKSGIYFYELAARTYRVAPNEEFRRKNDMGSAVHVARMICVHQTERL
jgi:hypothetical protein